MNTNRIVLAAGLALDVLQWASRVIAPDSAGGDKVTPGEVAILLEKIGNKILKEEDKNYRIMINITEIPHDDTGELGI